MSNGATVGVAAGAAAITQAIKASGAIVRVEPGDFMTIISRSEDAVVVVAEGGFFKKSVQYLTSYKGLAFYTKSPTPLSLPGSVEVIAAKHIWIPS